jgi:transcriptional regulator with XRE-family HTH domain
MNEIKRIRLEKGMTQGDLSIKSGVSQALICMYELGHRRPTPLKFETLARALGCTVADLSEKLNEKIKTLIETIDGLTDEQLKDVNEFVEFLKWKRLQKSEVCEYRIAIHNT